MLVASLLDRIVTVPHAVRQSLALLGLTEEIVREVAFAATGARASCLKVDPSGAPGSLSYFMGVRHIRLSLLPAGWVLARDGNVESTVNHELGVQLVFQNVDRACGPNDPLAMSAKGAGSRNLVKSGQADMFDLPTRGDASVGKSPTVWLLCVSTNGDAVCAEVSCPEVFEGNQFEGFTRRIFVVDEGLGTEPTRRGSNSDDSGDFEFDIAVTRK